MARYWQLLVKAQGDTKSAQQNMRKLQRASRNLQQAVGIDFRRIGQASALALGAGLAVTVKTGVSELLEAQRVTAQTNAVLKSTGNAARISATQLQDLAGSLSQVSGVDDELIQSGANVLLTFTKVRNEAGKNNDIFNQATRAALDMSVALKTDLKGANIQIGKALQDPIRGVTALRRAGVSFTKEQQDQIKTLTESGNVLGAQKIILQELEAQFGGSAQAAGSTWQGSLNKLRNTYAEMAATIVQAVLPSLGRMADKLNVLVSRVQAWASSRQGIEALGALRNALEQASSAIAAVASATVPVVQTMYRYREILLPVAAGIGAVVAALKIWRIATALATFVQAKFNMAMSANPIGIIVLAVVALAAAFVVLYKRNERFRSIVQTVIKKLKEFGRVAMQAAQQAWQKMQPVVNILRVIATVYIRQVIRNFQVMRGIAVAVWNGIRAAWGGAAALFGRIRGALNFSGAFNSIREGFRNALNGIIGMWNNLEFRIPGLPGKLSKFFDGATISTPNLPMLAAGGTITRRGAAIVGEAGPELLELPRGARVTPLNKTGNTYNITVNTEQRVDSVAFMRSLRMAARMGVV